MAYTSGFSAETYLYGERLAVILGFITLTLALAVIVSCRSFVSWSTYLGFKDILKNRAYKAFYRYHSYYWWGFWFIFIFHGYMGIMHIFMIPADPDPDAYLHWYSLGFGVAAIALIGGITLSCRVLLGPLNVILGRKPLNNTTYKIYYTFHSYYWLAFLAVIAAHYASGFLHSGLWPN
jgi:hypothetical protein